jgi:ABC-2 type transport system permease protein
LLLRGMTRNTAHLVSALILLLLFAPLAAGIAFAVGLGFLHLEPPYNGHLLRSVLLVIYGLWLLSSLFGYAFNESYDITRLFHYPVSVRQIFVGVILGSLLDLTTLLMFPTLIAVFVGFGRSGFSTVVCLTGLLLFVFHIFTLSQMVGLVSAGLLRSRRLRDAAVVLFTLFGILWYVGMQALPHYAFRADFRVFFRRPEWEWLNFLPPGLTARAMEAAQVGARETALGYLLLMAMVTGAAAWLAAALVQKVYEGDAISPVMRPRAPDEAGKSERKIVARPGVLFPSLSRVLPPVVRAVMAKEWLYILRDPYFRMMILNLVYVLVVAVIAFIRPFERNRGASGPYALWGACSFSLLSIMQIVCNVFGTEGGAIGTLFGFPCSRRQILLGKNLTHFLVLSAANGVVVLVLVTVARAWAQLPLLLLWMEFALVVLIAVGNLVSIFLPMRVVLKGWMVQQRSANKGCAFSLLYLVALQSAFLLLVPVALAFILPMALARPGWLALSLPLAALYALGGYALSLYAIEPVLRKRELDIMGRVLMED